MRKKQFVQIGTATDHPLREKPGVLVVEDDHLMRLMVKLGLVRNGFEVWLASNGREAIERYREQQDQIDVVLLDIRMPGLDGPATLDALRELNPEVRVCFMSGDGGGYDPEDLLWFGAARVFAKPFELDRLADFLRLLSHPLEAELLSAGEGAGGG